MSTTVIQEVDPNTLLVSAIGVCVIVALVAAFYLTSGANDKTVLPLEDFIECPLIKKEILSHDTVRFTFGLSSEKALLGLPIGQHLTLRFTDPETKQVHQRSYTPVSGQNQRGSFTLVIKVYKPNPPKFPVGGLMSQHLDSLKLGEPILMKGPKGHMHYTGDGGKFTIKPLGKPKEGRVAMQIGMMAGGTGITPMLQIANAIFANTADNQVKIKLIYANQTEDDILVRTELETLQQQYPDRFQLWYTIDRSVQKNWQYDIGFISKAMIEKHLDFDNKSIPTQFFMCGPPPMLKFACIPALQELGYTEKDWVSF